MSYNGTDNGYATFTHVRIPRTALLSRYTSVSRTGTYNASPLREKLLYGGMLNGRSLIIRNSVFQLAQAVTIATRYSVVRTQGQRSIRGEEPAVMNYKLQHYRLLTLTSKAYANIFASNAATKIYKSLLEQQAQGKHDMLPYVHMLMSGLKAWSTQTAADGAEDARKACGGHGYLVISGLPEIVNSVTACCTFEGENTVMWKQVSRYIIKGLSSSTLPKDMEYMGPYYYYGPTTCAYHDQQFLEPENLVRIFEYRAARLAHEVFEALRKDEGGKVRAEERHALALQSAARAHIELYILRTFISSLPPPSPIRTVLTNLLLLFALTTISSPLSASSSSFLEDAYFSRSQIATLREQTNELLEKLLPDAVALTDVWAFTDASLSSALGCKDGDVYRRIMEWTRQLPINVEAAKNGGVLKGVWEDNIRPFLKQGRVRSLL
jgi:acyl-CoA oxidase